MQLSDHPLERYMYSVAAKYIDLVDVQEQNQLVKLVNRLNFPITASSDLVLEQPADSFLTKLKEQWKEALNKPGV